MDFEAKPRAQLERIREGTILGCPKPGQSCELKARNTAKGSCSRWFGAFFWEGKRDSGLYLSPRIMAGGGL